jgi:hypothetical protein
MAYIEVTPQDVSLTTSGSWYDVDVSSYVPSGAQAVLIAFENTSGTTGYSTGSRENGSTDTATSVLDGDKLTFHIVGVDSNRIFEQYIGNKKIKTYLLGYFDSGTEWVFNTNEAAQSVTTGTWSDTDFTSVTSSDAVFVVIRDATSSTPRSWRANGNTSGTQRNASNTFSVTIIPVDSGQVAEAGAGGGSVGVRGYCTAGTAAIQWESQAHSATPGWDEDIDNIDNPDIPTTQIMGEYDLASDETYMFRKAGSTWSVPWSTARTKVPRVHIPVELNATTGDYDYYSEGANTAYISGTVLVSTGETVTVTKKALDWSGKAVAADVTALITKKALDWAGQPVIATVDVTEIPTTMALDWVGQGMTINESIQITKKGLDWAGQAVAADATMQVALVSLDWEGQEAIAKIAVLIDAAPLDWEGQAVKASETLITPEAALDWAGQALNANIHERITVSEAAMDWAGKEVTTSLASLVGKMALDWGAGNVWESETITLGAVEMNYDGKEVTATAAVLVGTAPLSWSGQDTAIRETIEVEMSALDYEGQAANVKADHVELVDKFDEDWVGQAVEVPSAAITIDVVALNWSGKSVIAVGQITRRVRILGCGFRKIIGA